MYKSPCYTAAAMNKHHQTLTSKAASQPFSRIAKALPAKRLQLFLLLFTSSLFMACSTINSATKTPSSSDSTTAAKQSSDSATLSSEQNQREASAAEVPSRNFPEDSFYDLLVAEFASREGELELALGNYLYQAQETRDADVAATATRLARHLKANRAALEAVQIWLAEAPNNSEANFIAASLYTHRGESLKALKHMERVLANGDEGNFAAIAASVLGQESSIRREISAQLDTLLEKYPGALSVKIAKALLMQFNGQAESGLQLAREVLTEDPKHLHALLVETQSLAQLGREQESIKRTRKALKHHPRNKSLRSHLAQLLSSDDSTLEQARAEYLSLMRIYPGDAEIAVSLALVNRRLGLIDEARALLRELLGRKRYQSWANYVLGLLAQDENKLGIASQHFEAVGEGNYFLAASKHLADIQLASESGLGAMQALFQRRRDAHPNSAQDLLLLQASLLLRESAYGEGEALMSQALSHEPGNTEFLYQRALFNEKLGNLQAVETDLRHILEREPDNGGALNALGYSLLIMSDRLDEAEPLIYRALELHPDDAAIIDSYGWLKYRRGELQLAREYLAKAYELAQDAEIAAHYGEVLWRLGETDKARAIWQEALEREPDSIHLYETMKRLLNDVPEATSQP